MTQNTAVVLDPNQSRRDEIRIFLSDCDVLPICFNDEWICLENLFHVRPAFVVVRPTSCKMAIHFICIARAIDSALPIIIISDQQALQRMIFKPWLTNLFFLFDPIAKKDLQALVDSFDVTTSNRSQPMLIAESPAAQHYINRLPQIGLSSEPVLIQGEPGVGKRLIARTIYNCSVAKTKLWKPISARDISGPWIRMLHGQIVRLSRFDSLLICYVIENIEALNDQMQSRLLMVMDMLEDMGKSIGSRASVRFIFLADTDLSSLCRNALFRKDLYYRLTVLNIHVPPLRHRKEDIPLLAEFFTAKYSLEKKSALVRLPEDIQTALSAYHWPGNVAQLEETIKNAMANGMDAWAEVLHQWCCEHVEQKNRSFTPLIDVDECLRKFMDRKQEMSLKAARQHYVMQMEKDILKTALFRTHGNCKKAASLLNISYKSMLNKVKAYQLTGRSIDSA
jgi:two-component system response regulator AtoC